jgi:site-specific DNA-methyltransferase (adenine-specific)
MTLHHGDLFDVLPTLEANSIDACVTDPPYGLGFMGKQWDTFKPGEAEKRITVNREIDSDNPNLKGRTRGPASSPSAVAYDRSLRGQHEFQAWTEAWAREVFRVLKPGAHMVVCGAPRSGHRMIAGVEDAGFEIRDCLCWLFGQGFPKSLDIGKAIDKAAGAERPVVGFSKQQQQRTPAIGTTAYGDYKGQSGDITAPSTNAAKQWDGWGTALKPAFEMIVLARKPFKGTVAENVLAHGTGGINVDACRTGTEVWERKSGKRTTPYGGPMWNPSSTPAMDTQGVGRWPSNVLLDEQAAAMLDEMSEDQMHSAGVARDGSTAKVADSYAASSYQMPANGNMRRLGDSGGASRFFYVAKPSQAERDLGIYTDALEYEHSGPRGHTANGDGTPRPRPRPRRNVHPTVKPIELMRWLIRLITPPGGTVLDPFCGSGTTGCACAFELRPFIGIEREAEYVAIAERRIRECAPLFQESGP